MYLLILRVHLKKRLEKDLHNDAYAMFLCVCVFFFLLIFFIKALSIYCGYSFELQDLMQFKWVPVTYAFTKK